jgi:hypothetical protein
MARQARPHRSAHTFEGLVFSYDAFSGTPYKCDGRPSFIFSEGGAEFI